jgi:hypothetical protein
MTNPIESATTEGPSMAVLDEVEGSARQLCLVDTNTKDTAA